MVKRMGIYAWIILFCLTAAAAAQEGPQGRWWHSPEVVSKLNLTSAEIQRLENAFDRSRSKMIRYKNQVEAEQARLQSLLEKRKLDENAVQAQHRKLEEARTALATERTAFVVEVRKIIGYERFQRLVEMQPQK
jgi:Spy/CpxP family protein refolding chaperone